MAAGGALVGLSAWIHLHLWMLGYRHVHVIGPLFMAQAVTGFLMALAIVALRRWPVALAGALFLAGTAAGLMVSDWWGLFGFHDHLDAPYAGMSLSAELAGVVVLAASAGPSLVALARRRL